MYILANIIFKNAHSGQHKLNLS